MPTMIDVAGFLVASVDGDASVASAKAKLDADPSNENLQIAYNAAYQNAIAAKTSLLPVLSIITASAAISADVKDFAANGASASTQAAFAANVLVLGAQGAALIGASEIVVPVAASTFTIEQLTSFAGALVTATGATLDASDISEYLTNAASSLGLIPNSDGSYNVFNPGQSGATITLDPSAPLTPLLDLQIASPSTANTILVPLTDNNGQITGYSAQTIASYNTYQNGSAGYTFGNGATLLSGGSGLSEFPNSPSAATPTAQWNLPDSSGTFHSIIEYSDGSYGKINSTSPGSYSVTMVDVKGSFPEQPNEITTIVDTGNTSAAIDGIGSTEKIDNATITVAPSATTAIDGRNNNISAGAGTTVDLQGAANIFSGGANGEININGSNNTATVDTGSSVTLSGGGGNTLNVGVDTSVYVASPTPDSSGSTGTTTPANTIKVNNDVSGSSTSGGASTSGITIGANADVNVVGSGNSLTAASGSQITVTGQNNQVVATDSTIQFDGPSTGDQVTGDSNTADYVNSSGQTTETQTWGDTGQLTTQESYAYGSSGQVSQTDATTYNADGSKVETVSNFTASGSVENEQVIETSSAGQVSDSVSGTGAVVDLNDASVTFANGAQGTVDGNNDKISLGANTSAGVDGESDLVNEIANSDTYLQVNGHDLTVNGDGGNDNVNLLGAGTSATVNGNDGAVGVCANNENLTAIGETVNFLNGGFGTTIQGSNDTINEIANSGAYLAVSGQNQVVNGNSGSTRTDLFGEGTSATVNGSGSSVGICGNDQSLVTWNEVVNFDQGGFSTHVSGSGDHINEVGNSGAYLAVAGQNQVVNGDTGSSRTDIYGDGTTATVNGSGSSVGVCGNNETLTTSNEAVNFSQNGFGTSVNGSGDTINENAGSDLELAGGSDTVNLGGSGDYVGLLGGSGYLINGSNDSIATWANTSLNLSGGNDGVNLGGNSYLGLLGGSGYVVNGSSDTINTWGGTSFNLSGGNDNVGLGGTGDYLGLLGGGGYSVNGSSDTIDTWGGTSLNLSGGNDNVGLGGTGDYLGLLGGSSFSVSGYNDSIATWANTSFNLSGGNDSVNLGGSGDYLGLLGGSGYAVNGSGDTIDTLSNTSFSLWGSNDGMGLGGVYDSAIINGSYDTVNESSYDYLQYVGTYDVAIGNATDGTAYYGGNYAGDIAYGGEQVTDSAGDGEPDDDYWDDEGDWDYDDDPVILNLEGGQVQTTNVAGSGSYFDMQNDGQAVQTAWATSGEGVLVYDPNNTGVVTRDSNLVAGYGALNNLAASTGDTGNTLTAGDALWDQLKVLVEPAGDNNPQDAKLATLSQLGITSINLNSTAEQIDNNGNTILNDSTFTWASGSTGDIAGVDLKFNPTQTALQTSATTQLVQLISAMAAFSPPTLSAELSLAAANDIQLQAPFLAAAH